MSLALAVETGLSADQTSSYYSAIYVLFKITDAATFPAFFAELAAAGLTPDNNYFVRQMRMEFNDRMEPQRR